MPQSYHGLLKFFIITYPLHFKYQELNYYNSLVK